MIPYFNKYYKYSVFLILVYKVPDICISARRRKEAMRWRCWLTTTQDWCK